LGYAFDSSCIENEVVDQGKENLKSRYVSFLIALTKELKNHLPNIKILRINAFSVNECLKANKLTDVTLYYGAKKRCDNYRSNRIRVGEYSSR